MTAGTSATLSFDLTISGLEASVIAGMDAPFRTLLTRSELEEYEELVSEYEGSLDIPFLEFLNANLATDVTVSDLREGCSRVSDCRRQTRAARTILANQTPTSIRLTGQISVSGTSAIPTTAFPVFRAAEVVLSDGRQVVIVSSNPADVLSSTGDGAVLGSGADSLTVTEA